MPRQHAIDRVLAMALEPWAITTPMLGIVAGVLARRLAGRTDAAADTTFVTRPAAAPPTGNGIAIIPIHGVIAPRINLLSDISGGATFEEATLQLREAVANGGVGTIVLDWDSPGGSVAGCTEFAREVLKARSVKPVVSVANFQMCSAAYWTGACATEVVAAPSAMVGSIGVYTIHEDLSEALDMMGVKVTYISAGKYKVDGNETEPLSDSARTRITAIVDAMYTNFVADVARGRGIAVDAVISGYGQGAVLTAAEALSVGMVDRVATLDDTISRIQSSPQQTLLRATTAQAPIVDTPQEPSLVTGQDRPHGLAALEAELLLLTL